jgi:MaoC dehydratase-like protein
MAIEKFPIEASHILMYARAIGDDNPIYTDDDYAASTELGGIIAPPAFMQAGQHFDPVYPLRPTLGKPWIGSGKMATSAQQGKSSAGESLHAEHHFQYHRHPRVDEVLTATSKPGKSWEKESKRSGKMYFSEIVVEYRDENDELVITETWVGVTTSWVED